MAMITDQFSKVIILIQFKKREKKRIDFIKFKNNHYNINIYKTRTKTKKQ